jgi:hypothetical protein
MLAIEAAGSSGPKGGGAPATTLAAAGVAIAHLARRLPARARRVGQDSAWHGWLVSRTAARGGGIDVGRWYVSKIFYEIEC